MIAADSSVLIDAMKGLSVPGVGRLMEAIRDDQLRLPPPVVTEILSFPGSVNALQRFAQYKQLELAVGFWERAAVSRRQLLGRGLRARLGDALIAQCCIDADVPLITRDTDFRHFATHCGLKLAV